MMDVCQNGTVRLADMSGKPLPALQNTCNLKKIVEPSNIGEGYLSDASEVSVASMQKKLSGVTRSKETSVQAQCKEPTVCEKENKMENVEDGSFRA